MFYTGDYKLGRNIYIPFNTFDSNDPQASVTITNLANTDIHIHKDDGTTQRNNAAGVTVNINYDSITGNHMVVIDTSDNTVDSFWQVGHDYMVRMEGTTIDAATVNAWIGHFSIENRYHPSELTPEYSVTSDWEQNEQNQLSGPAYQALQDDKGYGVMHSWELDEVCSISYVSTDNPRNGVDVKSVSRDEDAVDNLELDYDGTGYNKANSTIGTCTTNTDMRGTDSAYTGTPPTVVAIRTEIDSNSTQLAAIVADTNELQTDLANGGRLDLLIDQIITDIAALNNISAAEVNAEVVDALATDTYAESSGVPAATASIAAKIQWLATLARNKVTQTATTQTLRNDADSGDIATSTHSDAAGTYTRGEWA